jgi:hypothetical protein
VVAGTVGTVGEELLGGVKLGVGSRGSGNGQRRPAPVRSLRRSEEQNSGECGAEAVGRGAEEENEDCSRPCAFL